MMTARLDPIIERFRFAHQNVAIMFALGMTIQEIARRTGFTRRRLVMLLDDPTFNELINHYRTEQLEKMGELLETATDLMIHNHIAGLNLLAEQLDEALEPNADKIPIPQLIKLTESMGDRIGYAKNTIKTVNVNFATALERASQRSDSVRLIEGEVLPADKGLTQLTVVSPPPPRAYRRA